MSKRGLTFAGIFFLLIFAMGFISSAECYTDSDCPGGVCIAGNCASPLGSSGGEFSQSLDGIITDYINPITRFIIGGTASGDILLVKFLFWIILLALLYYSVKRIPNLGDNLLIVWVITFAISLIAIRYLDTDALIYFLWLPQGVLGVVLATILPFIIFLFFIESFDRSLIRKFGWSTFAVVYLMLAILRWEDLKVNIAGMPFINTLAWFYLAIAVVSILAMLLDRRFRAAMINAESVRIKKEQNAIRISELTEQLDKARAAASSVGISASEQRSAEARARTIEKKIDELRRMFA